MRTRKWILLAVLAVALSAVVTAQQFSGAIYTTKSDGTVVNQNLYEKKEDVYLNGGPQNLNAAGLPPGVYYFQVTTPGGQLLSTDAAVCRQVVVNSNGWMAGAYRGTTAEPIPCAHNDGDLNPANGNKGVQLMPFDDTTNPGGEYKVWLISQAPGCKTSVSESDPKVIIFDNSCAKTDNFKVVEGEIPPQPTISLAGTKYRDKNRNGMRDSDEEGLPNWTIRLYINNVQTSVQTTDADGRYFFSVPENAQNVKICEDLQSNWVQYGPVPDTKVGPFTADASKCWSAANVGSTNVTGLDFGNYNKVRLKGMKFYDTDNDGEKDENEPGLAGWTIHLYFGTSETPAASTITDPGGGFEFEVEIGTSYRICEVQQAGYAQTTTPTCWMGVVLNADDENLNFGNNIRASGKKYMDWGDKPGIQGFRIQISWCQESTCTAVPPVTAMTVTTSQYGSWSAVLPPPPSTPTQAEWWYQVCEVLPSAGSYYSWTQTAPAGRCYIVKAGGEGHPGPTTGLDFGNVCRPTFGRTIGFWSNKNGQEVALAIPNVLAELSALNLRNPDGSHYDPPRYSPKDRKDTMAFASWILNANAENMASMLSAQMAGTWLSVQAANSQSGDLKVWINGDWVTIGKAIDTANGLLSDSGCSPLTDNKCVVGSGHPLRNVMGAYKDLFDDINNNKAVMNGCPVTYPSVQ